MSRGSALHDALAGLFTYPEASLPDRVAAARRALEAEDPRLLHHLDPLASFVAGASTEKAEELFTRTFDINPACTLECGWHLYGEDYARGTFLVRMRSMLRDSGVEESAELPDHLCHVLPVLGRLEDEVADAFAADRVLPALEKMLEGFKDADNPYRAALEGTLAVLKARHGEPATGHAEPVQEGR